MNKENNIYAPPGSHNTGMYAEESNQDERIARLKKGCVTGTAIQASIKE